MGGGNHHDNNTLEPQGGVHSFRGVLSHLVTTKTIQRAPGSHTTLLPPQHKRREGIWGPAS